MLTLALAIAVNATQAAPNGPFDGLEASLSRLLGREGRVEVVSFQTSGKTCRGPFDGLRAGAWEPTAPITASGKIALRVRGYNCEAWAFAAVRVWVPALVASRDIKAGEALTDVRREERELLSGRAPLAEISDSATAARAIRLGETLSDSAVRMGPAIGSAITVRVELGDLSLTQSGKIGSCRKNEICATLPSGKRVVGQLKEGVLVVQGGLQ